MTIEVRNPRLRTVVDKNSELELLSSDFQFTEGPIWDGYKGQLTFSDIPGDTIYTWTHRDGVAVFRRPSNKANGNAYDRYGRILTCEHATSRVTRTDETGEVSVLATHYESNELNSPNDIIAKSDGAVYFTDPNFGRREFFGVPREQELSFQGVYRIDPEHGELTLLLSHLDQPNGLTFSPDESFLYVNDTTHNRIYCYDVRSDGMVENERWFAEVDGDGPGAADGLKADSEGNVYCTGPGGIHVFDGSGTFLGVIAIPEQTANFAFGGDDLCSVFVTASTSLYRFRVKVPGRKAF